MPWLTTDPIRLSAFRAGDRRTLARVYEHYALDLARTLASGISTPGGQGRLRVSAFDLDDVVQESFTRAFSDNARGAYDGVRPFCNYLMSIARNLIIDRHRRDRRLAPVADELQGATVAVPSPEANLMDEEQKDLLAALVAELDESDRILVELRFQGGRTRREVAAATGLSAMRVRTREKKLRLWLYQRLIGSRSP